MAMGPIPRKWPLSASNSEALGGQHFIQIGLGCGYHFGEEAHAQLKSGPSE